MVIGDRSDNYKVPICATTPTSTTPTKICLTFLTPKVKQVFLRQELGICVRHRRATATSTRYVEPSFHINSCTISCNRLPLPQAVYPYRPHSYPSQPFILSTLEHRPLRQELRLGRATLKQGCRKRNRIVGRKRASGHLSCTCWGIGPSIRMSGAKTTQSCASRVALHRSDDAPNAAKAAAGGGGVAAGAVDEEAAWADDGAAAGAGTVKTPGAPPAAGAGAGTVMTLGLPCRHVDSCLLQCLRLRSPPWPRRAARARCSLGPQPGGHLASAKSKSSAAFSAAAACNSRSSARRRRTSCSWP